MQRIYDYVIAAVVIIIISVLMLSGRYFDASMAGGCFFLGMGIRWVYDRMRDEP